MKVARIEFRFLLLMLFLPGCASLPSQNNRTLSKAFLDTDSTPLGLAIAPRVQDHPGTSGIYALQDARHAFAARVLLARAATRSLDVQYYIWHQDATGTLLFEALYEAADQGVRVRLLLDDNNTSGLDGILLALDAHPNIEVRLFNPNLYRNQRWVGYLMDFSRMNRRMHNKSFTVDNQATIIGGRNIGDEYFGATSDMLFTDLDVIAVGPVVDEVSQDFDRYWASGSSYPLDRIVDKHSETPVDISQKADALWSSPEAQSYIQAVRSSPFVHELRQGTLPMEWSRTRMISDDPAKGLNQAQPEELLLHGLKHIAGETQASMDLVSPYFVPTKEGVKAFADLVARGVKVRVLTNAMEATDVLVVHAGYAKYRQDLLNAGVELYEFRGTAPTKKKESMKGSSQLSLHAKTLAMDSSQVFIGSFNFDPRSVHLNTELGFVIESPELAQRIHATFDYRVRNQAYEIKLSNEGDIIWLMQQDAEQIRYETEPGTGFWERVGMTVLGWLPFEWLL